MALDTQLVPVVFRGLSTKVDRKLVVPGELVALENVVFRTPGILQKRNGYEALGRDVEGTTQTLSQGDGCAVFGDELLEFSAGHLYSRISATERMIDRGVCRSLPTTSKSVVRGSTQQTNVDGCTDGKVRVLVYEDNAAGVGYAVQDVDTGALIVAPTLITTADGTPNVFPSAPKVVYFPAIRSFVLWYVVGGDIWYRLVRSAQPTVLGAETNLLTNAPRYDVMVVGAKLIVAYDDTLGGSAKAVALDATLAAIVTVTLAHAAPNCLGLFSNDALDVIVAYASNAALYARAMPYSLSTGVNVTIETIAAVKRVTGYQPTGSPAARYFYEIGAPDNIPSHQFVRTNTYDAHANVLGAARDFHRSVGLASKVGRNGADGYVALVYHGNATGPAANGLQNAYFVADALSGVIVSRTEPGAGGTLRGAPTLAEMTPTAKLDATNALVVDGFEVATQVAGRLNSDAGKLFSLYGVALTRLELGSLEAFQTAKLGSNLIVGGGVVQAYDGESVFESGFHLFPEQPGIDGASVFIFTETQVGDGTHQEKTDVTCRAASRVSPGQYFQLNSPTVGYYLWCTVDGAGTDPAVGGRTGIKAALLSSDVDSAVATKIAAALAAVGGGAVFTATSAANVIHLANVVNGAATPTANAAAPNGLATGSIGAGTYGYAVTYEHTDRFGQIHRSAPSVIKQVTTTGTPGSVSLTVATLRLTARAAVRIVVYRTINNGTTYYRVTSLSAPTLNDVTRDSVSFIDIAADASITSNDVLYTEGALENIPPPSAPIVTTYRGRAFVSNGTSIFYSKVAQLGEAVAFSDALRIDVDQRGGDIVALAAMDDKLVILKEQAIFVMAGNGPSAAGAQSDYGDPVLVTADVGCTSAKSVCAFFEGLVFQSSKGIYLLNRSLSVSYLGQHVEAFNAARFTSATLLADTNELRFTVANGPTLVFNYFAALWSTFTGVAAVSACVWQGRFVLLRADGAIWRERTGAPFVDGGGAPFFFALETSDLQFAHLAGFQRVRKVFVTGDYRGAHTLRVRFAKNFSPAFTQDVTFDAASIFGADTWGSAPVWGATGVWGGVFAAYQLRCRIGAGMQRSTSLRMRLEELQAKGYNEGVAINGVTVEVGLERGGVRLPASQKG